MKIIYFSDLLIPIGYKKPTSYLAKYSIKVYKGEMIRYFDDGPKWLSIYFGMSPEVSIVSYYLWNN
jgi:hypothetical protein